MKTTTTIKQTLLALTIALSIASCKKDKKDEPTPPPVEVKAITLTDLKALSTGASVKVPDAKKITGIVISDVSSKNIDSKTVVLQDAASQVGIIVTFDAAQTFAVGDQVEVDISGQTLAQVNGEIELTNVPAAKAKKTGTGTVTAKATTAADIATNKAAWDGTLVTIAATDLTGTTSKYSGTLTIKDASGTISSTVLAGASFEGTDYPISLNAVTGIIRMNGNDLFLDIRNTTDVSSAATRFVTEDFKGYPYTYLPVPSDDFLQQDRAYYYIQQINPHPTALSPFTSLTINDVDITGLKTISVTFAGSNYTGPITPFSVLLGDVNPFTSTSKMGIMIALVGTDGQPYPFAAVDYNEIGKFFTLNAKVPASVDELVAAFKSLADSGNSYWGRSGFNDPTYMTQKATTLLSNGPLQIAILNNSTQRQETFDAGYAPVIIDKAVLGFDK